MIYADIKKPRPTIYPAGDLSDAKTHPEALRQLYEQCDRLSRVVRDMLNNAPAGGSGDVATDAIWDAKGDLAVATGADTAIRVGVGLDGTVLTAKTSQPSGVIWQAPVVADADYGDIVVSSSGTVWSFDSAVVTAAGRAILDDANAAAQRATLGAAATSHTHTLAEITDDGALAALNTVGTTQIDNDAVTYAKMQNVGGASRLLGRGDSGGGDPQEITIGTGLSFAGTVLSASGGSGLTHQQVLARGLGA